MTMKIKTVLGILLFTLFVSCSVNNNVVGTYRSNFAELGFFVTRIELKENKTFHYVFSGDLLHTELDGKYVIENKNLYLRFDRLKGEGESDVFEVNGQDTIINWEKMQGVHDYELNKENEIEYHLKYKIYKNKLFGYKLGTNKLIKKARLYSGFRKYIVFGPRYYNKKSYLKKRKS